MLNYIGLLLCVFVGYGRTTIENAAAFDESTEARATLVHNFLTAVGISRWSYTLDLVGCIVFMHFYNASQVLTAWAFQKSSRPQQLTLCRSLHAESLQTTVSEGLDLGPYVAARTGFKHAPLQLRGVNATNTPPRPTRVYLSSNLF